MVLSDRLQALKPRLKNDNECAYMTLYNSLSKEDRKAIDEAWEKNIPMNLIVRALRQEGHKTSNDSIRAHKKGDCRCPKES